MVTVNKFGVTMIRIGIIKTTYDMKDPLFNLEAGTKKAFGLLHCKEYVERYEAKDLFPKENTWTSNPVGLMLLG